MVKQIKQNANPFDDGIQLHAILYNLSQNYLKIKSDLVEYDLYLDGKNQLEQKLIQLESKAADKSNLEKMPEFELQIKTNIQRTSLIADVFKSNDFKHIKKLLDAVEQEWIDLETAYPKIRNYTPIYQQPDISIMDKKQIYFDQISSIDALVQNLKIDFTSDDYAQYQKLMRESKASILYGNFTTGHDKLYKAIDFLSEKFLSHDPRIIMDVSYDDTTNMLTVNGAVYKHFLNSRDNVVFSFLNSDGDVIEISSVTTKHGDFQILSNDEIKSGLHIAQISHGSTKKSQLVSIHGNIPNMVFSQDELLIMELGNTFESLESFVSEFNNFDSEKQLWQIQTIINKIKQELEKNDAQKAITSIQNFKNNIKLYMPIQSSEITIDASTTSSTIKITGKIKKLVQYREPIFLTVFDNDGKRVYEQMTHDDAYGNINIAIPKHMFKGLLVIQIEYHDFLARDIIEIESPANSKDRLVMTYPKDNPVANSKDNHIVAYPKDNHIVAYPKDSHVMTYPKNIIYQITYLQ